MRLCVVFLHALMQFILTHKLAGAVKNVVKTKTKDQLVSDYNALFNDKVNSMLFAEKNRIDVSTVCKIEVKMP